jgi:hypothetical protein
MRKKQQNLVVSSSSPDEVESKRAAFHRQVLSKILGCKEEELGVFYDLEKRFPGVSSRAIEVARRDHEYPGIDFFLSEAKLMVLDSLKGEVAEEKRKLLYDVGLASDIEEVKNRFVWIPSDCPVAAAGRTLADFVYGDIDKAVFLDKIFASHTPRSAGMTRPSE